MNRTIEFLQEPRQLGRVCGPKIHISHRRNIILLVLEVLYNSTLEE